VRERRKVLPNNLTETSFEIPIGISLIKSVQEDDDDRWSWEGVGSVEIPDLEEETLVVKGMDISYLEEFGVINWNHGKQPGAIVGEVTKAMKILDKQPAELYLKGIFYKSLKAAQELQQLMKSLETDSLSKRQMCLSLEGKAISRENKRVVKSKIHAVAATMQPINTATYAVLTKGMCHHPESDVCMYCEEDCLHKAVSAPSGTAVEGSTGGEALTRQSLEGGCKCNGKCKDKAKGMTRGQMIERAISVHKFSKAAAETAVKILFPV